MHSLEQILRRAVACSLACTILITPAFGQDCVLLSSNKTPLVLGDRQLYYRQPGSDVWANMNDAVPNFSGQNINFAYVIVENFDQSRAGVLVVKSGRIRQIGEPQISSSVKQVHLVRLDRRRPFDNRPCALVPAFGRKDVSAQSYDDYHDRGLTVPDIKTIEAFHFEYVARHGGCHSTNNASIDSPWDPRSNRGQFSFDPNIVGRTTYSQVAGWFSPNRAYASSDNLAEQSVEMKQYRSVVARPVCVRFNVSVPGSASFLRINDLESLSQNGLRYVRSDEQTWSLSR